MMSLLIVILAITLSAIVVFGGVSYFSHDLGIRTETAAVVKANYETIVSAIVNYRTVNNGRMPAAFDDLVGYLPNGKTPIFPKYKISDQPYLWKLEGRYLCLYRAAGNPIAMGIDAGISNFVNSLSRYHTIKIGPTCARAVSEELTTENVGFNTSYLDKRSEVAFAFKVN